MATHRALQTAVIVADVDAVLGWSRRPGPHLGEASAALDDVAAPAT